MKILKLFFILFAVSTFAYAGGTRFTPEEKASFFKAASEISKSITIKGSELYKISDVKKNLDPNLKQLLAVGAISQSELVNFNASFDKKYKGVQEANKNEVADFLKSEFDKINNLPIPKLHESCMENNLCANGSICTVVNTDNTGIGSCIAEKSKKECSSDKECCSNKCSHRTCVANKVCMGSGTNGKPDCWPLSPNADGTCGPQPVLVSPEIQIPKELLDSSQGNIKHKSIFEIVANFIIPTAEAVDAATLKQNLLDTKSILDAATQFSSTAAVQLPIKIEALRLAHIALNNANTALSDAQAIGPLDPGYSNKAAIVAAAQTNVDNAQRDVNRLTGEVAALQPAAVNAALQTATENFLSARQAANDNAVSLDTQGGAAAVTANLNSLYHTGAVFSSQASKTDLTQCKVDLVSDYRVLLRTDANRNITTDANGNFTGASASGNTLNYLELEAAMAAFDFVAGGEVNNDVFSIDGISLNQSLHNIAANHAAKMNEHYGSLVTKSKELECRCFLIKIELFNSLSQTRKEEIYKQCSPDQVAQLQSFLGALAAKKPTAAMADADGTKAAAFITAMSGQLSDVTASTTSNMIDIFDQLNTLNGKFGAAVSQKTNKVEVFQERLYLSPTREEISRSTTVCSIFSSFFHKLGSWIGHVAAASFGGFSRLVGVENSFRDSLMCGLSNSYCPPGSPAGAAGAAAVPLPDLTAQGQLLTAAWKDGVDPSLPPGDSNIGEPYQALHPTANEEEGYCDIWPVGNTGTIYYKRGDKYLHTPYNRTCNKHIHSAACVTNFSEFVDELTGTTHYLIDPFIPMSYPENPITKSDIVNPTDISYKLLEDGYQNGITYLKNHVNGTLGVLTPTEVFEFRPKFNNYGSTYKITPAFIAKFKANAKAFAVSRGLFAPDDADNLTKFANYAYRFHFIFPKQNHYAEIGYEPIALKSYLEFLTSVVAGSSASSLASAALILAAQHAKYQNFQAQLLATYPGAPGSSEAMATSQVVQELQAQVAAFQEFKKQIQTGPTGQGGPNISAAGSGLTFKRGAQTNGSSSSSNMTGASASSSSLQTLANAINKYNNIRQSQLKKRQQYLDSIANNKEAQARNELMSKAAQSFASTFASPTSGSGHGGSAQGQGLEKNNSDAASQAERSFFAKQNSFGSGMVYGNSSGGRGGRRSGSTSKSKLGGKRGDGTTANSSGDNSGDHTALMDPDSEAAKNARALQDAIDARNRNGLDKYGSDGSMTIFEIITNTYIRNYDKVIIETKK